MDLYRGDVYYAAYQEGDSTVTAVAISIIRISDGKAWDFNDDTWKASGWTQQWRSLAEGQNGLWTDATGWTTPQATAQYQVQLKVTYGADPTYAGGPILNVNQRTSEGVTPSSTATTSQGMLDAVNAAIAARLNGGAVSQYSIGGRNIQYMSMGDLMKLRSQLQTEVAAAAGGKRHFATFTRPS